MLLFPRRCFKLFWKERFLRKKKVMQQSGLAARVAIRLSIKAVGWGFLPPFLAAQT